MLYNALSVGKETPKIAPSFEISSPYRKRIEPRDRKHARQMGQDRACGSGDLLADRQTHAQTCSSQYFTTAPASKVKINHTYFSCYPLVSKCTFFIRILHFFSRGSGTTLSNPAPLPHIWVGQTPDILPSSLPKCTPGFYTALIPVDAIAYLLKARLAM